jgi:hypothetical protein
LILIIAQSLFFIDLQGQKSVDSIPKYIIRQCVEVFDQQAREVNKNAKLGPLQFIEHKREYEYAYTSSSPDTGVATLTIPKSVLVGDIDNDGTGELIITATGNFGGIGSDGYEFVFEIKDGKWELLTYLDEFDVFLEHMQVIDGQLVGTTISWDKDDAHCCPTLVEEKRYKYDKQKNQLIEVGRRILRKVVIKDGE